MNIPFRNDMMIPVDTQIEHVLAAMSVTGVDSEKYPILMTYLERLYEIKMKQRRNPVSHDTIAIVVGNILGILVIVAYEQKHVITSKGFTQIIRPNSTK